MLMTMHEAVSGRFVIASYEVTECISSVGFVGMI